MRHFFFYHTPGITLVSDICEMLLTFHSISVAHRSPAKVNVKTWLCPYPSFPGQDTDESLSHSTTGSING